MNYKDNINKFKINCKLNGILYAINSFNKNKDYYYYSKLNKKKYKKELKEWYYYRTGEILNYNNPENFNQKIQYLKLNDSNSLKTLLSDKYKCREWITDNIGKEYLVPLLGVWNKFDDIDFDKLPNKFVIKCNHGSGFNYIVKDKSKLNINELKEKVNKWMDTNFAFVNGFEMHYKDIKPVIICEEYLGDNLIDLQAWCSNGKIMFFSYIYSPHGENKKATYDENWNPLDFYTSLPIYNGDCLKPKKLKSIKNIANKVSKNFKFVRVDFYITNSGKIFISEFTFTPASGYCGWSPSSANKTIGDMLDLGGI